MSQAKKLLQEAAAIDESNAGVKVLKAYEELERSVNQTRTAYKSWIRCLGELSGTPEQEQIIELMNRNTPRWAKLLFEIPLQDALPAIYRNTMALMKTEPNGKGK